MRPGGPRLATVRPTAGSHHSSRRVEADVIPTSYIALEGDRISDLLSWPWGKRRAAGFLIRSGGTPGSLRRGPNRRGPSGRLQGSTRWPDRLAGVSRLAL